MRNAETILNVIRERGRRGLPLERKGPETETAVGQAYGGPSAQDSGGLSELP
jgi:hypothetical protein